MLVLLECLLALSTGPHEWGEFYNCLLSSSHPVIDSEINPVESVAQQEFALFTSTFLLKCSNLADQNPNILNIMTQPEVQKSFGL